MKDLLDDGAIEPLVTHLREIAAAHADAHPDLAEEVLKEAEYFATKPVGCAIRSSAARDCSLAPAWWKLAARVLSDRA